MTLSVRIEELAPCQKRLAIEIAAADVRAERNNTLKEFKKLASLPGFRKGHAPDELVNKRYSVAIDEETRSNLIRKSVQEALRQQGIRPATSPRVEEAHYQPGTTMALSVVVETAPDFSLPEYSALSVSIQDCSATEDEVEAFLANMLRRQATYSDMPTECAADDTLLAVIDYRAEIEGQPLTSVAPEAKNLTERSDFWLPLRADHFLPGLPQGLYGAKAGETREVTVVFPGDFPHENLRGRAAQFHVTVKALKKEVLPELNEDFAKQLGADSLDNLRARVREIILQQKETELASKQREEIARQLLGAVQFDVPETILQHYTREIVQDIVSDNTRRGIPAETLTQHKEQILDNATRSARDRLRLEFILARIAAQEKLSVSPQELLSEVAHLAQLYGQPVEKITKTLTKTGGIDRLENDLLTRKTLEHLRQMALGKARGT